MELEPGEGGEVVANVLIKLLPDAIRTSLQAA